MQNTWYLEGTQCRRAGVTPLFIVTAPFQLPTELYNVHCTMYTVQCTLYNVHCTMYTVQCTLYNVHCTMYTVQCTLYNVHCTMYTVQCTLYNVHCTMYSEQCTVYMDRKHIHTPRLTCARTRNVGTQVRILAATRARDVIRKSLDPI